MCEWEREIEREGKAIDRGIEKENPFRFSYCWGFNEYHRQLKIKKKNIGEQDDEEKKNHSKTVGQTVLFNSPMNLYFIFRASQKQKKNTIA